MASFTAMLDPQFFILSWRMRHTYHIVDMSQTYLETYDFFTFSAENLAHKCPSFPWPSKTPKKAWSLASPKRGIKLQKSWFSFKGSAEKLSMFEMNSKVRCHLLDNILFETTIRMSAYIPGMRPFHFWCHIRFFAESQHQSEELQDFCFSDPDRGCQ